MVVIGAGPYGLSVAAHLRAAAVPVRIFGEVMGSWRHSMATGMFLKSTPDAVDLSAPVPGARLADFRRAQGEPPLTELTPIPNDVFVDYGQWFQERHVGEVESTRVVHVAREEGGPHFLVTTEKREQFVAAAVVIATGLGGLAHVPQPLRSLAQAEPGPQELVSHTSQHRDLSRYAGQRVLVVGGGQSALESAALLHESGAQVEVLVRERRVRWGSVPRPHRAAVRRWARPDSPLGTGWALAGLCRAPGGLRRAPAPARAFVFRKALGPSGGWWLRERVEGVLPVRTASRVVAARSNENGARLDITGPGGKSRTLEVDHVLAATGYKLDVDALAYLDPDVRGDIVRVAGSQAPWLTETFEATVPGVYVVGSMAALTFGPMLRFVAGTEYAATRVARDITARIGRADR
ncbi:NAD(P)-binding domain-containing protein [Streptomyces sp. VRA16 Mangrove soil]|uniref:NAD(P)-binding domain-containing protein n=1 Tax=Streptomyces sp. VRA16 Mangrove soil TaxID=2817434 RepID=UPI0027DB93F9|nr:NAD(P)-binding domain-containing protein [Streptomyces sp. VRA16 Mangrove soil]